MRELPREISDAVNDKKAMIVVTTIELLEISGKKKSLISDWENMLKHQIANLETCQNYWDILPKVFEWLNG